MNRGLPTSNLRSKQPEVRANTLRLDQRTLTALMDKLDSARAALPGARRRYCRLPYRHADIQVTFSHPGGTNSTLILCARDISAGGLSLLHSSYVHKGTVCSVTLDRPGRSKATLAGKVVRCAQLVGLIHEVGIAFNTRVSLRDFLCPDPLDEFYSIERVDPAELTGRVLHIDNTNLGRRLLKAFLNESRLVIEQVGSVAQGVEAAKGPFDVVVTEYPLPDGNAVDLIDALRLKQIQIPVIVLFGETSTDARERLRRSEPAGILNKPFSQDRLQRSLAEVLLLSRPQTAIGDHPADQTRTALVQVFMDDLRAQARDLQIALKADRTEDCLRVCRELRGAAPTLGFAQVAQAAEAAEKAIISGGAASEAVKEISDLMSTCQRAAA